MNAAEFFTMAFTLACILGPAMGLFFLIGLQLFYWLNRRGFSLTIGLPPAGKEAGHEWE